MGARDAAAGEALAKEIRADHPDADVRVVALDVTDDDSVATAYDSSRAGAALDVLVNNAGIIGARAVPAETGPRDFLPAFGVNLLGPVRVTHAFLPMLRSRPPRALVMVSSGMGSFGSPTTRTARVHPAGAWSTRRRRRR